LSVQPAKPQYATQIGVHQNNYLQWHVYTCESCSGLVAVGAVVAQVHISTAFVAQARWIVPSVQIISSDVPPRAANYLNQARETLSSPAASVVMSASAVDAMLKERGYKDGSLYGRIQKAEREGVLTAHMADWAHDIRLDANDERHADDTATDAAPNDASRCLEFAETLADLLFVLPARVKRGRKTQTTAVPAIAAPGKATP
jgi:Domain of unknown function (DUF4145)